MIIYKSLLFKGYPNRKVGSDGSILTRCKPGSTSGEVISSWRKLKTRPSKSGHIYVGLTRHGNCKNFLVHRLVLEAFVGACPKGKEARHFPDRNPSNNNLRNLSWATHKINQRDRKIHGTTNKGKSYNAGESHPRVKLTKRKVLKIRRLLKANKHPTYLAKRFRVSISTIRHIEVRRSWRHLL